MMSKIDKELQARILVEIIFTEKKNYNTKEKSDIEMRKTRKSIIEKEVRKSDI